MVRNGFTEPKMFSEKDLGSISLPLGPVSRLLGNPVLVPVTEEQRAHCARWSLGQLAFSSGAVLLCQGSWAASGVWDRNVLPAV